MLLAEPHHFLDLGQNLSLAQHQRIETCRHPEQVSDGLLVVEGEQVGLEFGHTESGVATQKGAHCRDPKLGMAQQGVDLEPIAGAED